MTSDCQNYIGNTWGDGGAGRIDVLNPGADRAVIARQRMHLSGPLSGRRHYGREKGREALWNFVQTNNVAIKMKG